jgi:hypothetical protein
VKIPFQFEAIFHSYSSTSHPRTLHSFRCFVQNSCWNLAFLNNTRFVFYKSFIFLFAFFQRRNRFSISKYIEKQILIPSMSSIK